MKKNNIFLVVLLVYNSINSIAQVNNLTNNNVGIGTSMALDDAKLTIKGNSSSGWKMLALDGNTDDWFLGSFGGGGFFISKDNFGSSNAKLTIINNNVGIGTTTPIGNSRLDVVAQSGAISGIAVNGQRALDSDMNNVMVGDLAGGDGIRGLILRAGDQDRMFVSQYGNVGIGYSNPQSQLIVGSSFGASLSGTSGGNAVFGTNIAVKQGGSNHNKLYTPYSHGGNYGYAGVHASWGKILFYTSNENTTGGNVITPTARMTILTDGNIGIGTSNPSKKLEIYDATPVIRLRNTNDGAAAYAYMEFNDVNSRMGYVGFGSSSTNNMFVYNEAGGDILIPSGNVGIGTGHANTLGYKLAVNGTIGAKEVKVEVSSPWPDYVFSKNYNLKSLKETEAFIQENHHLPEIPSSKEVLENGIHLGEMNAKLLQKIEELTLHLINQQKEIQAQNTRMGNMEKEMKKLREAVN